MTHTEISPGRERRGYVTLLRFGARTRSVGSHTLQQSVDDPLDEALLGFAQPLITLSVPNACWRHAALRPDRHLQARQLFDGGFEDAREFYEHQHGHAPVAQFIREHR